LNISELREGVIQIRRKALRAGGLGFVVDLDHSGCQAIKVSHFQVESKVPNKTDAGNGSKAICRVSNVFRSPSPDPKR
jgi:hypothetical protein